MLLFCIYINDILELIRSRGYDAAAFCDDIIIGHNSNILS
jgi:hypothetical protein